MAVVTGMTAQRMLEIEAASVVDGDVVGGNLVLTKHDGTTIDAGSVIGPAGPQGPQGLNSIPGEVKLWPSDTLPDPAQYGLWVWADGAAYDAVDHPIAANNIAAVWKTFGGALDPGAGKFRVPDLRGLVASGMDAMPGGVRANRMTRAVAITLAGRTGKETHVLAIGEIPAHNHGGSVSVGGSISGSTDTQGAHSHVSSPSGLGFAVTNQTRNVRVDGSSAYNIITGAEATDTKGSHSHSVGGSFSGSGGIPSQGGGVDHENVQPTVFVPYIVCLDQ